MTSLERYMAVLRGEAVDLLPRTPILMQFAAEYIGSNYAAFASDHRVLVAANAACARDFGMDQVSCISDPFRETQGFGGVIEYMPDAPPRCSHPLEETKDLSVLSTPDPMRSERMLDRVHAARLYGEQFGGAYSILGWVEGPAAEAADLRGVNGFLLDLIEDESFACELMDLCVAVGIEFARAQVDAGADTVGIGDALASQVSPDLYERLIQPREKTMVRAIHDMGAYVKLHICGNISHLLDGVGDLGVDILDVDHMVRLSDVRNAVGGKVVITGNIDPVSGVSNGTPESIHDAIRRMYAEAGDPYMINAGCEIPASTPRENLLALCEPVPRR